MAWPLAVRSRRLGGRRLALLVLLALLAVQRADEPPRLSRVPVRSLTQICPGGGARAGAACLPRLFRCSVARPRCACQNAQHDARRPSTCRTPPVATLCLYFANAEMALHAHASGEFGSGSARMPPMRGERRKETRAEKEGRKEDAQGHPQSSIHASRIYTSFHTSIRTYPSPDVAAARDEHVGNSRMRITRLPSLSSTRFSLPAPAEPAVRAEGLDGLPLTAPRCRAASRARLRRPRASSLDVLPRSTAPGCPMPLCRSSIPRLSRRWDVAWEGGVARGVCARGQGRAPSCHCAPRQIPQVPRGRFARVTAADDDDGYCCVRWPVTCSRAPTPPTPAFPPANPPDGQSAGIPRQMPPPCADLPAEGPAFPPCDNQMAKDPGGRRGRWAWTRMRPRGPGSARLLLPAI